MKIWYISLVIVFMVLCSVIATHPAHALNTPQDVNGSSFNVWDVNFLDCYVMEV